MIKLMMVFTFLVSSTLASVPNVVLLSSVDTPKIWYHKKTWEIENTLNKIFKNRFKDSGYNIVIREKVDQFTLRRELKNPDNIAIFWVSHSKDSQQVANGLSSDAAIVDYYGNDVKDLFKEVHPNLRFLGLVGCNAKNLIAKYHALGDYKNSTSLKIHSYDKKVDARIGLRKSIKKSASQLGKLKKRFIFFPKISSTQKVLDSFEEDRSCLISDNGYPIDVERYLDQDSPAVSIKASKNLLHVFPAGVAGQTQRATLYVPTDLNPTKSSFKITVDSNKFYGSKKMYLGSFSFDAQWDGVWKAFAKRDGTLLGVTKNLYRFKGLIPSESYLQEFNQYQCR